MHYRLPLKVKLRLVSGLLRTSRGKGVSNMTYVVALDPSTGLMHIATPPDGASLDEIMSVAADCAESTGAIVVVVTPESDLHADIQRSLAASRN